MTPHGAEIPNIERGVLVSTFVPTTMAPMRRTYSGRLCAPRDSCGFMQWVEELSHVLWAHRTTIKVSTGDTPFSLVYGTEAVIPAEIGMPTIRTAEVNIATNDDERRIDLDILEERREQAAIREEKAKLKMKGYLLPKSSESHLDQGTSCIVLTTQATQKTQESWDQSGKDPTRLRKHLEKDATSCRDLMGVEFPARGISAISINANL
ncbi:reverse transcriptase domain-containing protein [Tanacetum coccineum]